MIHILDTLLLKESGRFLAADPPGAIHGNLGRLSLGHEAFAGIPEPRGEIAKTAGFRIDCILEAADRHLIFVSRVDDYGVRIGDQGVPVARFDIGADTRARIHAGHAHGNDLGLQAHLHPLERHGGSAGHFHVQIGAAGQGADMIQHLRDLLLRSGDGSVDAFCGQQQGSAQVCVPAYLFQRLTHVHVIVEASEAIERGHADGGRRRRSGIVHGPFHSAANRIRQHL